MSDSSSHPDSSTNRGGATGLQPFGLRAIDTSMRVPAVVFGAMSVLWLFVATLFALITSFKLHTPGFLGQWELLTFGRVQPAYMTMFLYGWATNAGFGVAFWIMARLSRNTLQAGVTLYTAAAFWNVGVLVAIFGILIGHLNPHKWLEMPGYAAPLLFVAFALIAVWAVLTFRFRRSDYSYVSQWYLLAALFWFPAIFGIACLMLVYAPARGVVQSVVGMWYAHNLYALWLTPIGLAAAYYFIPKILGKPVHSYYFAAIAFWTYLVFASWAGTQHLAGGPVPAWIISSGIVGSLLTLFPVVIIGINHHVSMAGNFGKLRTSPTLRFVYFGAVAFTSVSILTAFTAFRSVREVVQFTYFMDGQMQWGIYAWFTMAMFGALYYIMPRVLNREWPSAMLIRLHFWTCASGIVLYVLAMCIGGWIQGIQINNPGAYPDFVDVVGNTMPWLVAGSLAGILLLLGHAAFAIHFFWILLRPEIPDESRSKLFKEPKHMKVAVK